MPKQPIKSPQYYYCMTTPIYASESCFIFTEVKGLSLKVNSGISIDGEKNLPALVLKRGIGQFGKLWNWINAGVKNNRSKLLDLELSLHGPEQLFAVWRIKCAKPIKAAFAPIENSILIEQLEISFSELHCMYPTPMR